MCGCVRETKIAQVFYVFIYHLSLIAMYMYILSQPLVYARAGMPGRQQLYV